VVNVESAADPAGEVVLALTGERVLGGGVVDVMFMATVTVWWVVRKVDCSPVSQSRSSAGRARCETVPVSHAKPGRPAPLERPSIRPKPPPLLRRWLRCPDGP
jgi:hypothetical protein